MGQFSYYAIAEVDFSKLQAELYSKIWARNQTNVFTKGANMPYRIIRENNRFVFEVIIPCVCEADLSVSVDKHNISISRAENKRKCEKLYESYDFRIDSEEKLDIPIKEYELAWKKAESEYKNGVLTVKIPRLNPAIALLTRGV